MAGIGLKYPVIAQFSAHTAGSEPTYLAGMFMGKARQVDLNIERSNNPLRGDDEDCENDNSITAMTMTVETDDILNDAKVYMGLLDEKTTGTAPNTQTYYLEHDGPSKELGFGYMRKKQKNNEIFYEGVWVYNVMMAQDSDTATTRPSGGVEWQTPTVTGRAKPLMVDNSGKSYYRKIANFQTEAAALAWLKGLAGITD